jgi:SNF2 family DNA or RNA helicase
MHGFEFLKSVSHFHSLILNRCIGCLLLTGTPMKNGRPSNLFPLLRATRHPFGDDQKLYEFFFCNGQNRRYGNREVWDASGSSNLALLNAHITSHILHKTKDDCLNELPEKIREYKTVPVGSKYEIQHNRALNELVS